MDIASLLSSVPSDPSYSRSSSPAEDQHPSQWLHSHPHFLPTTLPSQSLILPYPYSYHHHMLPHSQDQMHRQPQQQQQKPPLYHTGPADVSTDSANMDMADLPIGITFNPSATQKPFACGFCGRSFWRKFDCKRHMRTHTHEKPYQCLHCEHGFARKDALNRHLQANVRCRRVHDKALGVARCVGTYKNSTTDRMSEDGYDASEQQPDGEACSPIASSDSQRSTSLRGSSPQPQPQSSWPNSSGQSSINEQSSIVAANYLQSMSMSSYSNSSRHPSPTSVSSVSSTSRRISPYVCTEYPSSSSILRPKSISPIKDRDSPQNNSIQPSNSSSSLLALLSAARQLSPPVSSQPLQSHTSVSHTTQISTSSSHHASSKPMHRVLPALAPVPIPTQHIPSTNPLYNASNLSISVPTNTHSIMRPQYFTLTEQQQHGSQLRSFRSQQLPLPLPTIVTTPPVEIMSSDIRGRGPSISLPSPVEIHGHGHNMNHRAYLSAYNRQQQHPSSPPPRYFHNHIKPVTAIFHHPISSGFRSRGDQDDSPEYKRNEVQQVISPLSPGLLAMPSPSFERSLYPSMCVKAPPSSASLISHGVCTVLP